MDVFGKEEMEVSNTDAEPEELRDFLASLASYVLACDVTLQDGETIGFSADDKHTLSLIHILRQLTDIKNEVPDEDGIREIVDLWKNEDSGEIAPADRKSTRLNSSHSGESRMPSSA